MLRLRLKEGGKLQKMRLTEGELAASLLMAYSLLWHGTINLDIVFVANNKTFTGCIE